MNLNVVWLNSDGPVANRILAEWGRSEDTVSRHKDGVTRQASLVGRAVLRALLVRRTGRRDLRLEASANGKIISVGPGGQPGPAVSMSHTRGTLAAVMAQADVPLGIDVESHRLRNFAALAAHAFGPRECAAVTHGGAKAFYRIWTLREAMAKATGIGLSEVTDRRDRVPDGPAYGVWHSGDWQLACFSPAPGLSLAVALRASGPATLCISDGQVLIAP